MVYACQRDSYLREFKTTVVSCSPVSHEKDQYEVILEDTILFPEGGGQPWDHGSINGIPVIKVTRKGKDAIHLTERSLNAGDPAQVIVDWQRRFDHMQQHTGQHLITALAESLFSYQTTSWNLGEEVSYIELNTSTMAAKEVDELECILNDKIRNSVSVNVSLYDRDSEELKSVKTRLELPEDHIGPVRVVTIDGIDKNTCCGTHVCNLSQLQMIKLLYVEKGKKGKSNLHFVCGSRSLKYFGKSVERERILTSSLKCQPHEQPQMVEKLLRNLKLAQKNALNVLRDVTVLEARQMMSLKPRPAFYSYHRKEGDIASMNIFANEVKDSDVLLFLSTGDEKGSGQVMLTGPTELVQELGPNFQESPDHVFVCVPANAELICKILEGKGATKNGKFQARVENMGKRLAAENLLRRAIESQ